METLSIATATHGRVLVDRPAAGSAAGLIVGCHGYGELADQHLEQLRQVPGSAGWLVVSVQALHRFYRGRSEQVAACWMTHQDREVAIADNIAYFASIVRSLRTGGLAQRPLVYTGFSQGASMAWRAALRAGPRADGVVVLGGDIPPDVRERWDPAPREALVGRGRKETWYSEEVFEADCRFVDSTATRLTRCEYDGGHEWVDEFRARAGDVLARLSGEADRGGAAYP